MTRSAERLGCAEFRRSLDSNRRDFCRAGMLGASGLWLAHLLRAEEGLAAEGKAAQRANSVIILWMRGGPSHIDMWDMKPHAPVEYRGEFRPIPTTVPDIHICELLPRSAAIQHKWSIIRSLHGGQHSSGDQLCFTGYPAGQKPDQNVAPSVGSVVAKQLGPGELVPNYVIVPRLVPGADSAYLGPAYRPFQTQADPAGKGRFVVRNLQPPQGLSVHRLGERRTLLGELDRMQREVDRSGMMEAMDSFQQQAWQIVTSDEAKNAFDLEAEPQQLRERYGIYDYFKSRDPQGGGTAAWNQRMLLARRLVEAGVRLVTVDCRWWDTHQDNFWSLKNGFLPRWDKGYSALIEDLDQRGLLETTLVVAWGEMGRTPRINTRAGADRPGRDHWPDAMSAAIAGGGVQGGRIIGSTDRKAERPLENPKSPQDVLATIYRHLGVDTSLQYIDHAGRPHPVLPFGSPIDELF